MSNSQQNLFPLPLLNPQTQNIHPQQRKFIKKIDQYPQLNLIQTRSKINQFMSQLAILKKEPLNIKVYKLKLGKKKQITYLQIQQMIENSLRKMTISKKKKKNWNQQDIIILLWIIQKYNFLHRKNVSQFVNADWFNISQLVPGKNPQQCMFKWLSLPKLQSKQLPPWTQKQDTILKELVQQYSQTKKWKKISKKLYLRNTHPKVYRIDKKCRQRWQCHLNPKLKKGMWSNAQDMLLFKKTRQIGKKWSIISKILQGRTQNAVKNRYQLLYEKRKKLMGNQLSEDKFIQYEIRQLELNSMLLRQVKQKGKVNDASEQQSQSQCGQQIQRNEYKENNKQLVQVEKGQQQIRFAKWPIQRLLKLSEKIHEAKYDEQDEQLIIYEDENEVSGEQDDSQQQNSDEGQQP